jgi:hypothetical protein
MSRTFALLASVLCAAVGAAACHGSGQGGGDMGNDMPPMMYQAPTPVQACDAQAPRAAACAPVER